MQAWCGTAVVVDLHGIDLPADARLLSAFRAWSDRFRGDATVERVTGKSREINRHALEMFLLQNSLISQKWAAVYLGMESETFRTVVNRLETDGVPTQTGSSVSDQVVRQREAAQLFKAFPSLRNKIFSDHSRMCRALHDAIQKELKIKVDPVLCVTSSVLDSEPDVAAAFDAITGDPVGLRYQVWLETKKPVSLRPDVCSLLFYARNTAELRGHVMKGSEPESIDARLSA
jgi:hypothetical protein